MQHFVGMDIGGTNIKYGIVDDKGNITSGSNCPTNIQAGITCFISNVKNIVDHLLGKGSSIGGIGISTAGVVHPVTGEIIHVSPTLPGYQGTNLKKQLEEAFQIPVVVENDVNAAALGEAWMGAGKSIDTFFCLTLGTGIGGAFVINKKLYKGTNFRAGEVGYMGKQSEKDNPYEQKAATSALIKRAKQELQMEDIEGQVIFEKAKSGDLKYQNLIWEWTREIAKGLANIICVLDPGVIIVGGAVSNQGTYLMEQIYEGLRAYVPEPFVESTILKPAECGNNAGILGAVYPFVQ